MDVTQQIENHHLQADLDKAHNEIRRLGCTYPQELCHNLAIPIEKAKILLHQLLLMGRVRRIIPHPFIVNPEIARRLNYFWSVGIHGYEMFARIVWVSPKLEECDETLLYWIKTYNRVEPKTHDPDYTDVTDE